MADMRVKYIVRASGDNLGGLDPNFECLSGFGPGGAILYDQTRTLQAEDRVFVTGATSFSEPLTGTIFRYDGLGQEMFEYPIEMEPGDQIRVTCAGGDILLQSGAVFTVTEDGSLSHSAVGFVTAMTFEPM